MYAKRVHEMVMESPATSPLPRMEALLRAATESLTQPCDMDPACPEFAAKAVEHVRALLLEKNRVSIHAQRRIGQLLDGVSRRHSVPVGDLIEAVNNRSGAEEVAYYRRIRDSCSGAGCEDCTAARQSDECGADESARQLTCDVTQRTCLLKAHRFQNFTTSFLSHCRLFAALPDDSQLLKSSDPQGQVRELVESYDQMSTQAVARGFATSVTGRGAPLFALGQGESPMEAVQYCDGDGGHIVADKFPGLSDYLSREAVTLQPLTLQWHGYTLLPFRELYHDAIELGHEFNVQADNASGETRGTGWVPLGYRALVAARGNLGRATQLWIVPSPSLDRFRLFFRHLFL
jgi:hypothetical protein